MGVFLHRSIFPVVSSKVMVYTFLCWQCYPVFQATPTDTEKLADTTSQQAEPYYDWREFSACSDGYRFLSASRWKDSDDKNHSARDTGEDDLFKTWNSSYFRMFCPILMLIMINRHNLLYSQRMSVSCKHIIQDIWWLILWWRPWKWRCGEEPTWTAMCVCACVFPLYEKIVSLSQV